MYFSLAGVWIRWPIYLALMFWAEIALQRIKNLYFKCESYANNLLEVKVLSVWRFNQLSSK